MAKPNDVHRFSASAGIGVMSTGVVNTNRETEAVVCAFSYGFPAISPVVIE